jgi:hypothetical protein
MRSGAIAKDLVMATSGLKYVPGDCGSSKLRTIITDDGENYIGKYVKISSGYKKIQDASELNGKVVKVRSTMYCTYPTSTFCDMCSGDMSAGQENAITLQATGFGGSLLKASLKKMHGGVRKLIEILF